jgi:hypothetical protein
VSNLPAQDGKELQEKIRGLISGLETEVAKLTQSQSLELEELTQKCRQDIQSLHLAFTAEIDSIQLRHAERLTTLTEEINYLKEMSNSQRIMMESNLQYIKELEVRYLNS